MMTTLTDAVALSDAELRTLAIVLTAEDAAWLRAVAAQTTTDALRVEPVPLTDGRYLLCADLLTESDGRLRVLWDRVDDAGRIAGVDLVPMASVAHLLPSFPGGAA
jgi:hypothetical protein